MASRGKSICRHPGCGKLLDVPGYCPVHARAKQQVEDRHRGSAYERGYTSAWTKARAAYLRAHPLCVFCLRDGLTRAANVVDHKIPHRLKEALDSGDEVRIAEAKRLFWDSGNNWQSLCKPHHDGEKQRQEKSAQHQS